MWGKKAALDAQKVCVVCLLVCHLVKECDICKKMFKGTLKNREGIRLRGLMYNIKTDEEKVGD